MTEGSPATDWVDYIVVGAGSSGCAVAARLAHMANVSVRLLEAGGNDNKWSIRIPAGYYRAIADRNLNWAFETEPEPELRGRRISWPRGRVVGGSSSINGLVYIRGQIEDYEAWSEAAGPDWSWNGVEPHFKRLECFQGEVDPRRGTFGPIGVTPLNRVDPLSRAFVETCVNLGWPENPGFNGITQEGAGLFELTTLKGTRASSAQGYLRRLPKSPNLQVQPNAMVDQILFDGSRAVGVRFFNQGRPRELYARKEVILCAGAIGSPALLIRSGVGPPDQIKMIGGNVVSGSPEVGANLQDHFQSRIVFSLRNRAGLNGRLADPRWLGATIMSYLTKRDGPIAIGAGEAGLFAATDSDSRRPDVQVHFLPFSTDAPGKALNAWPGMTMSVCQLRPESRGTVSVVSADPNIHPIIRAAYLSAERDREVMRSGLLMLRKIAQARPMADLILDEVEPGLSAQTDDALLDFARERGGSIFHPCGTCRMGADLKSVVDPKLRVRGIGGLRVADASVMPQIISGNTNAAALMIGEKAADLILESAQVNSCMTCPV